jgi:hypothetical protein
MGVVVFGSESVESLFEVNLEKHALNIVLDFLGQIVILRSGLTAALVGFRIAFNFQETDLPLERFLRWSAPLEW